MTTHGRASVVRHIPNCLCGWRGLYYPKYDVYGCESGDVWLEPKCSDINCSYCSARPEKPSLCPEEPEYDH